MAGHTDVVNGASACSSEDDGGVLRGIVTELMETSSDSSESDDDEIYQIVMDNSDSDDEDLLEELLRDRERKKRNSIKNYLEEVVPTYTEAEFKMHFRISKELFLNLSAKFEESDIYIKGFESISVYQGRQTWQFSYGLPVMRHAAFVTYPTALIYHCRLFLVWSIERQCSLAV
ncbi:PREDICTED: uncharacterized protein LOC108376780 [Rhagoletis zephyria]|uniref:uncharacterized protein LOC108376780 n=1 Tax=Rhagoletis zephyria TaxID=28612 RepID=UPI000811A17D|nr:PREDICTED: uncharacterized protein LOC108376780 [Rhagoletis zephyria]